MTLFLAVFIPIAILGFLYLFIINKENNRSYVVVKAVESLFKIIDRGITDRENAEHIKDIKETLNALEGGRVVDA